MPDLVTAALHPLAAYVALRPNEGDSVLRLGDLEFHVGSGVVCVDGSILPDR